MPGRYDIPGGSGHGEEERGDEGQVGGDDHGGGEAAQAPAPVGQGQGEDGQAGVPGGGQQVGAGPRVAMADRGGGQFHHRAGAHHDEQRRGRGQAVAPGTGTGPDRLGQFVFLACPRISAVTAEVISGASAPSAATSPSQASDSPARSPRRSSRETSSQLADRLTATPATNNRARS